MLLNGITLDYYSYLSISLESTQHIKSSSLELPTWIWVEWKVHSLWLFSYAARWSDRGVVDEVDDDEEEEGGGDDDFPTLL